VHMDNSMCLNGCKIQEYWRHPGYFPDLSPCDF
jgi:hypothetical protein